MQLRVCSGACFSHHNIARAALLVANLAAKPRPGLVPGYVERPVGPDRVGHESLGKAAPPAAAARLESSGVGSSRFAPVCSAPTAASATKRPASAAGSAAAASTRTDLVLNRRQPKKYGTEQLYQLVSF